MSEYTGGIPHRLKMLGNDLGGSGHNRTSSVEPSGHGKQAVVVPSLGCKMNFFFICRKKNKQNMNHNFYLCFAQCSNALLAIKLLLLSLFDVFGSRQRGTKCLLTACQTQIRC